MSFRKDFNVFVGSKTGILKGVKVQEGKTVAKTTQNIKALTKEHEITALSWGDDDEKDVLLGLANQTVKIYDTEMMAFTQKIDTKCGEGPIVGVTRYNGSILTAVASGQVKLWCSKSSNTLETGGALERFRVNPYQKEIVATGGKNNDLKLWNIASGNQNVFKAKNVPHNHLQLQVPVWVSDMTFMNESNKMAVCTRYGQVRVYDPSAQKRPVLNMEIPEKALISIAAAPRESHIVVGAGSGQMLMVDLRYKGVIAGHYKGITGSVREIICTQATPEPLVVSVSLDRHLRVHNFNSRKLVFKEYLLSKINCLLVRKDFCVEKAEPIVPQAIDGQETVNLSGDEADDVFATMETISEEPKKRKTKIIITGMDKPRKKKKLPH